MKRRDFLKTIAYLMGYTALLGLFPSCFKRNQTMSSDLQNHILNQASKLNLRQIVENRLHHNNGRFINPFNKSGQKSFTSVLYWKLFKKNEFKELYRNEQIIPVNIDWQPVTKNHGCSVTFIKHSSIMISDHDQVILVDPVFNSLFSYTDFSPLEFGPKDMPLPDHILITHGHYDHLQKGTLSEFKNTHVITPLGYETIFDDRDNLHTQLDWFDSYSRNGLEIICLPCNHWTMRNPLIGPNTSLWSSFLVRTISGINIYISGDTAYFDHFRDLGEEYDIDLAIFNLGAYEPRWFMADSHINPEGTVKAFQKLGAKHLMVVHWGAFRLGDEPVYLPPLDMKKEMEKMGLSNRLIPINPGQTLFYEDRNSFNIL